MELKFKTDVEVEIDYDSIKPKGFDFDSRDSKTNVFYNVNLEIREWGIKNMSYVLINQEITCYITLLQDSNEDSDSYLFKINITDCETEGPEDLNDDLVAKLLNLTLTEITKIDDHTFSAKASATLTF